MIRLQDNWSGYSYEWESYGDRLSPKVASGLLAQVAGAGDDDEVPVPAGALRALLAPHIVEERETGAIIRDSSRDVEYRVKVGRAEGRHPWLSYVEVRPNSPDPDPRVFRVPAQRLAAAAAEIISDHELHETETSDTGSDWVIAYRGEGAVLPDPSSIPTPEELCELVGARGLSAQQIAERYERSVPRVYAWLGKARKDRPELPWPPRRGGPKPKPEVSTDEEKGNGNE